MGRHTFTGAFLIIALAVLITELIRVNLLEVEAVVCAALIYQHVTRRGDR